MSVGRNDPCPCGSGRKFKFCHGNTGQADQTLAAPPTTPTANLFRDAQARLEQADFSGAIANYQKMLTLNPEHADARHYLGMAMCFQGQIELGLAHLQASVGLRPRDEVYQHNLALWLEESGDLVGAERHFLEALALRSDYRVARYSLAKLLLRQQRNLAARSVLEDVVHQNPGDIELGQLYVLAQSRLGEITQAHQVYREMMRRNPDHAALRLSFAENLLTSGHEEDARREAQTILAQQPGHVGATFLLASLEERCNRLDEARRWTEALLRVADDASSQRLMARIQRRMGQHEDALATLDSIKITHLPLEEVAHHYMERGTILDKLGKYDDAFKAFRLGKDAARQAAENESGKVFYSESATRAQFDVLRRYFTRSKISTLEQRLPTPVVSEPLFIVGFPRSGTTLVEQMLAAHPNIHAGGELIGLNLIESTIAARLGVATPYPDCLDALTQPSNHGVLQELREHYRHLAREVGAVTAESRWFTDKMPLNETHLGLIQLLFPRSPVLHLVRHPLDVVLSCFANELTHGKQCAFRIETAAFHYFQVMELVEQQVAELNLRYRRIRYEDLLANPEAELRALFEFVGEPWDPRCLEFHRVSRVARTASYAQVNRPLYRTSKERWRHYRQHLAPAMAILAPLIKRLGYKID
jgi:tetratricopeptide (TPR) repeat protein